MALMRIPGTLLTSWLVRPCPMKPAPIMPTRIGMPRSSRAWRALSTMIMTFCLPGSHGHPSFEILFHVGEERPPVVLDRDLRHGQRPCQLEPRIVVQESTFRARRIEFAHLVAGLRLILEDLVAVGEPFRHVQTAVIVGRELDGDVVE